MNPGVTTAEVRARPADRGEGFRPTDDAHPAPEGHARNPWGRHLQDDLVTDPPPLPQPRIVDLKADRGEVLTEVTVGQFAAEPLLPVVEILALEGVDRLGVTAVVLAVADVVADEPATQPDCLGSRRPDLDATLDRTLSDAGGLVPLPRIGLRLSDIHRVDKCHRLRIGRLLKFWPSGVRSL